MSTWSACERQCLWMPPPATHLGNASLGPVSCSASILRILDSNRITVCWAQASDYAQADSDASAAILLEPGHVKAHHRRGMARVSLGRLRDAMDDLQVSERWRAGCFSMGSHAASCRFHSHYADFADGCGRKGSVLSPPSWLTPRTGSIPSIVSVNLCVRVALCRSGGQSSDGPCF